MKWYEEEQNILLQKDIARWNETMQVFIRLLCETGTKKLKQLLASRQIDDQDFIKYNFEFTSRRDLLLSRTINTKMQYCEMMKLAQDFGKRMLEFTPEKMAFAYLSASLVQVGLG